MHDIVQFIDLDADIRKTRRLPEYNAMIGTIQDMIKGGHWQADGGLVRSVLDKRIVETCKYRRRKLTEEARLKGREVTFFAGVSGGRFSGYLAGFFVPFC